MTSLIQLTSCDLQLAMNFQFTSSNDYNSALLMSSLKNENCKMIIATQKGVA